MHLKWQFALWKLHRAGKLKLIAVEPYVENRKGDFTGHVDAIIEIDGVIYLVDFKGYQPRVYKQIVGGYIPEDNAIQLTGYMMIVSAGKEFDFKVEQSLLVVESKSGPDEKGSPLGLVEVEITKKKWAKVVKAKLDELREYERNEETPPPACHSTRQRGFQTCPWSGICLEEVREIQRRESADRRNPSELAVAVPEGRRTTNSRRSRRRKR
jgi:signal recognition particle subunit SEC65